MEKTSCFVHSKQQMFVYVKNHAIRELVLSHMYASLN